MAYFPQFTYPNGSQTHYGYPRLTLAGGYKYGVFSSVKPDTYIKSYNKNEKYKIHEGVIS